MDRWRPINLDDLECLVDKQLLSCSPDQQLLFEEYRVPFYHRPINRMGKIELVYVVAWLGDEALYYEDIEDGFELGRPDAEGIIPSRGGNQYELRHLLGRIQSNNRGLT